MTMIAKRFKFLTNCVNTEGDDINEMKNAAEVLTRRAFLRFVDRDSMKQIEEELGYSRDFRMSADWHVSYHKSQYRGKPCVYFRWSAIEYVFVA